MSDITTTPSKATPATPHLDAVRDIARAAPSAEVAVAQIANLPGAHRVVRRARIEETAEQIARQGREQDGGQHDG